MISEVISEVISKVISEVISEVISKVMSEVISEVISKVMSEVIDLYADPMLITLAPARDLVDLCWIRLSCRKQVLLFNIYSLTLPLTCDIVHSIDKLETDTDTDTDTDSVTILCFLTVNNRLCGCYVISTPTMTAYIYVHFWSEIVS